MKETLGGRNFKVSITTDMFNYSFRPEIGKKLRLFAKYGFEYIHWCDDWNNDVIYTDQDMRHYSQLIESAELKCLDVHGTATTTICIDAEEENLQSEYIRLLKNRIEFCAIVGGDVVVIHPPDSGCELSQRLNRSLHVFERVRPLCEELAIALAVENCHAADEEVLKFYFEKYPPEFVGFCFDSGHSHVNKNFDQLVEFGERLKALHLHDNKGERDDHQPPFWGTIEWKRVMRWIENNGYEKPINFEITHNPQLFDGSMDEFLEYTVHAIRKVISVI